MTNRMLGRIDGHTNYATGSYRVTSGVTVTAGDFVYFDGVGEVTNATVAGARLVGMALSTVTGTAANVEVLVCIDPMMRYLVDNDNAGATFAVTDVGKYFDLTGATGAQLVDTNTGSATTGQLVCLEYNPKVDPVSTDTSQGVFKIAEHFLYPLGS
jgi:hypothetical protein